MEKKYYKRKIENLLVVNKLVTIHYFEFDKDFRAPLESHDFWELVYADKESVVCYADEKEIVLNEGEILFHKPNEVHTLKSNGKSAPNVFIVSFECKSEAIRFFENKKLKLQKNLLKYAYAIIEESKKTFNLPYSDPELKKMQLLEKPALGGEQLIKNFLEILLVNLIRLETEKEDSEEIFLPQEELGERVADRIVEFLKANIYEKLTVADVCRELNYNKSYIFKQFKTATGKSVLAYFTLLKIERAKRLLRETNLSVSQISEKLAFDSPNYFSKTFKKHVSFTPLQYKKIHKR